MDELQTVLAMVLSAETDGRLSASSAENIRTWLTEPYLEEYAALVVERVRAGAWKELEEAFWTTIPFGTGGRRGKMYPIGCNAINDRTIGESAQGLADFVKQQRKDQPHSCAIAYDTRHRSRHFAELCAQIMAAAGMTVHFLDGYRSTPELSFAVRHKRCSCGIMITASHNPPQDNAMKIYGAGGGQLLPPHDAECIERMKQVTRIKRIAFAEGLRTGKIVYCQEEVDRAYVEAVLRQAIPGPRGLKVLYSPLHGTGVSAVCPVLEADGFSDVVLYGPHAIPDPEFSNVPGRSANPENAALFEPIIEEARRIEADLVLVTDPDADRLGCAARESAAADARWRILTGNQIGALLADFLLEQRRARGELTPEHYVVKTLVTTELIRRVADHHGATTVGDLLVGFKYIGGEMDRRGPEKFVFGAEESYGFLAGDHARDKDAAVASMLLCELAARLKAEGRTLSQRLDELFARHGCHAESQWSLHVPGAQGMGRTRALLTGLRAGPPERLGGLRVARVRDYGNGTTIVVGRGTQPLEGPRGDLIFLDLEPEGNSVAVRPSGTEPKVKFYLFAYDPPDPGRSLESIRLNQKDRLAAIERDLRALGDGG